MDASRDIAANVEGAQSTARTSSNHAAKVKKKMSLEAYRAGNFKESLLLAEQAIAIDGTCSACWTLKAASHLSLAQVDRAAEIFCDLLRTDPSNEFVRRLYEITLRKLERSRPRAGDFPSRAAVAAPESCCVGDALAVRYAVGPPGEPPPARPELGRIPEGEGAAAREAGGAALAGPMFVSMHVAGRRGEAARAYLPPAAGEGSVSFEAPLEEADVTFRLVAMNVVVASCGPVAVRLPRVELEAPARAALGEAIGVAYRVRGWGRPHDPADAVELLPAGGAEGPPPPPLARVPVPPGPEGRVVFDLQPRLPGRYLFRYLLHVDGRPAASHTSAPVEVALAPACPPHPRLTREMRLLVLAAGPDLQAERALLRSRVFPAIRRMCEARGVAFTPVDLCGPDGEAAGPEVAALVAREAARARPVLLLIGDRYGPPCAGLPPSVCAVHPHLRVEINPHVAAATAAPPPAVSVAELGVACALAWGAPERRQLLAYARAPGYGNRAATDAERELYEAAHPFEAAALAQLRARVDAALADAAEKEEANAERKKEEGGEEEEEEEERENVGPGDESTQYPTPAALASSALRALEAAVEEAFSPSPPLAVDRAAAVHEALCERLGREAAAAQAAAPRALEGDALDPPERGPEHYARALDEHLARCTAGEEGGSAPLVVRGLHAGVGVSCALAQWVTQVRARPGAPVTVFQVVGRGSERRRSAAHILSRVLQELRAAFDLHMSLPPPDEPEKLAATLSGILSACAATRPLLLVLDGLHYLDVESARLHWLPARYPPRVCAVLSGTRDFMLPLLLGPHAAPAPPAPLPPASDGEAAPAPPAEPSLAPAARPAPAGPPHAASPPQSVASASAPRSAPSAAPPHSTSSSLPSRSRGKIPSKGPPEPEPAPPWVPLYGCPVLEVLPPPAAVRRGIVASAVAAGGLAHALPPAAAEALANLPLCARSPQGSK